jgi:AAA15 family ATPase/GTPase
MIDHSLRAIHIKKLQGINDAKLEFYTEKRLIAIMGVNGVGKSTIIHALRAVFKPLDKNDESKDVRFSAFFKKTKEVDLGSTRFTVQLGSRDVNISYSDKRRHWNPDYENLPERDVEYLGINTCVPAIENENKRLVNYTYKRTEDKNDDTTKKVIIYASAILDIEYEGVSEHIITEKKRLRSFATGDITYSSLTTGAGEQRIFKILQAALTLEHHGLLIIDEIDLLLHINALKRLIKHLDEIAKKRKLQIVFTTHSMAVNDLKDYVDIKYLKNHRGKTMVYDGIPTDEFYNMTGKDRKHILIYVEDALSQYIVHSICEDLECLPKTEVFLFGAAANCFTLLAGKALDKSLSDGCIFVLDGDVYRTVEEKTKQMGSSLTGTEEEREEQRKTCIEKICQYNLPDKITPEQHIKNMLNSLNENDISVASLGNVWKIFKEIPFQSDPHNYIDELSERLGYDYSKTCDRIISLAKLSNQWSEMIEPVKEKIAAVIAHQKK